MSRAEQKEQTYRRILDAAGRGFRSGGFGGVGVDGLAKLAGVTSGAFYTHFPSKECAFEQAVLVGVEALEQAVRALRETQGEAWLDAFIDFYLNDKRVCELGESCAVQSLVPEVGRADPHLKAAVETRLQRVVDAIADGLPGDDEAGREGRAWALLALLSGGVSLARAVQRPALAEAMAQALGKAAREIVAPPLP